MLKDRPVEMWMTVVRALMEPKSDPTGTTVNPPRCIWRVGVLSAEEIGEAGGLHCCSPIKIRCATPVRRLLHRVHEFTMMSQRCMLRSHHSLRRLCRM
uniref:Uncharacterized protein n=1 Tax=Arundo donax TaxID=35708 RepID=A0A0A8ZX32_ARUDO